MRLEKAGTDAKGWSIGPWNSEVAISIGYANQGIDEPHLHTEITEIYLVVKGQALIRIEQEDVDLTKGDILVVMPGEAHTFLSSSPDYFHYVIHTPGLSGEQAKNEKRYVSRERLSL